MKLIPKNWASFQHYKDRAPAWIKLHKGLLDDYEFASLPVESRAMAPMLWLLASEKDNGCFDASIDSLTFRLRMTPKEVAEALHPLIEGGFFLEADGKEPEREKWPSRYISDDLRNQILDQDGHRCVYCGSDGNLEIDHKIPVSKGGQSVAENLQTLCRPCNRSKRTKSAEQVATQDIPPRSLEKRREQEEIEKENTIERSPKATRSEKNSDFEKFWEVYPRRLGANPRNTALQKFKEAVKQGADPASIIEGARRCAASDHDKIGTPYIPQAIKWLKDRRWEDYAAGPPGETLSDTERNKLFEELRNGSKKAGGDLRATSDSPCQSEGVGRSTPTVTADNKTRHAGMVGLGAILPRSPGVRAGGDETS